MEFHDSFGMAGRDRRQNEAADGDRVREVKRTYLRENFQADGVVVFNDSSELELHAKRFELNGYRVLVSCCARNHRVRQLAACQKLGRFSIGRKQVRFSQNLQNIFLLQSLDGGAQVDIAVEDEEVHQVAQPDIRALNTAAASAGSAASAAATSS